MTDAQALSRAAVFKRRSTVDCTENYCYYYYCQNGSGMCESVANSLINTSQPDLVTGERKTMAIIILLN